jgi:hypothetical protein
VGALLSGLLSDLAGRKVSLIVGASSSVIGATLQTSSIYLWYKVSLVPRPLPLLQCYTRVMSACNIEEVGVAWG